MTYQEIQVFDIFLNKILGLNLKKDIINNDSVLEILLELRDNARKEKDYKLSDNIRDELAKIGINLNDKDQQTSCISIYFSNKNIQTSYLSINRK